MYHSAQCQVHGNYSTNTNSYFSILSRNICFLWLLLPKETHPTRCSRNLSLWLLLIMYVFHPRALTLGTLQLLALGSHKTYCVSFSFEKRSMGPRLAFNVSGL